MLSFTTKQKSALEFLVALILGLCLSFIFENPSWLLVIGISGVVFLLVFAMKNMKYFMLLLLAVKPFIDLSWSVELFKLGGTVINPLRITGILVFCFAIYLYFVRPTRRRLFNEGAIWLFLILNILTCVIAVLSTNKGVLSSLDNVIRVIDAYLLYLIFHRFIQTEMDIRRIVQTIWISTLLVSIGSIVSYFTGSYEVDVSQQVERFAGLYNDPGTPAYTAVISMMFGSLYLRLLKSQGRRTPLSVTVALVVTMLVAIFLMRITITKSAIVSMFVFVMMWWGVSKKKLIVVIPLVIIVSYYAYTMEEEIRVRTASEVGFVMEGLSSGEFTVNAARPIGSGRVYHWEQVLSYYYRRYNTFEKLMGTFQTFSAHNQYIAYLMQLGIIGLTVFIAILARFYGKLISLYRIYRKPELYMAIIVLTVFIVYGMTGHPFYYTTLLWYLMILLSFINVYRFGIEREESLGTHG